MIANASFGFQVSAEGSGYTWSVNSQQNQITPWSNDPVSDAPGEVIYLRDEESGDLWSPTALPIREEGSSYVARHGQGYSRFEHVSHGIALEMLQFVPVDDPIKIIPAEDHQPLGRSRRLSVTAYVEWMLGSSRSAAQRRSSSPRSTRRPERCLRETPGASISGNAWRLRTSPAVSSRGPATGRSSWAATARSISRPHLPALHLFPTGSAPVSILAALCRPGWSSRRTARPRSFSFSARRRRGPRRKRCLKSTGPPISRPSSLPSSVSGTTHLARFK